MDDAELLDRFATARIPADRWDHRTHLRIAYLHLRRWPFPEALERMRTGIQAVNRAVGRPENETSGYHETATVAWLRLVAFTLAEYGPGHDSEDFLTAQPQLTHKQVLRFFYSPGRFLTAEARQSFVEPDLAPLPRSVPGTGD